MTAHLVSTSIDASVALVATASHLRVVSTEITAAVEFAASAVRTLGMSTSIGVLVDLSGSLIGAPKLLLASAMNSRKIRVQFDQAMTKDSALLSIGTYTLTPLTSDAVAIYISGVTAEDTTYPTYVDLAVTEMTGGQTYRLVVNSGVGAPRSRGELGLQAADDTTDFLGLGLNPEISLVQAISANRVDVKFTEAMLDNEAIRDKERYVFDNGLIVTEVLELAGDTVKLATTTQVPGLLYTLTIS